MKTLHILPAGALAVALALVTSAASAQVVDSTPKTTTPPPIQTPQITPATTAPAISDSTIVADLISANRKEIAAADAAIAGAESEDVKELARRLQVDHTKIVADLESYLQKRGGGMASGITGDSVKPTREDPADTTYANQETKNQPVTMPKDSAVAPVAPADPSAPWAGKTGKEFDKAWVQALEDKHEEAVKNLRENIIPQIQDSDLKALVQGFLPIMGNHLRDLTALDAQFE